MAIPMTTPGAFSWVELMTNDQEAARKFYSQLFGWSFEKAPGHEGYSLIKVGSEMAGGMMDIPQGCPSGPCFGVYVTVADADAAAAKAKSLGARVLVEPQDVPGVGRFAVIQDPQGAVVSIMRWAHMK